MPLVLSSGDEEEGATTLSTRPKLSGRGEPPCDSTGKGYTHLLAVMQQVNTPRTRIALHLHVSGEFLVCVQCRGWLLVEVSWGL